MIHHEKEQCLSCKGEGYLKVHIRREDGYYDRVYEKCVRCDGLGAINVAWSDTPFIDYVKKTNPPPSPFITEIL